MAHVLATKVGPQESFTRRGMLRCVAAPQRNAFGVLLNRHRNAARRIKCERTFAPLCGILRYVVAKTRSGSRSERERVSGSGERALRKGGGERSAEREVAERRAGNRSEL